MSLKSAGRLSVNVGAHFRDTTQAFFRCQLRDDTLSVSATLLDELEGLSEEDEEIVDSKCLALLARNRALPFVHFVNLKRLGRRSWSALVQLVQKGALVAAVTTLGSIEVSAWQLGSTFVGRHGEGLFLL